MEAINIKGKHATALKLAPIEKLATTNKLATA